MSDTETRVISTTVDAKKKVDQNISYLGSGHQNKPLDCKLLRIRLLHSGKCLIKHQMKGFNTNIMNFILFIRNQSEKHNSPPSHWFASLEAKDHISHGFGRWTFAEGNVAQVAQNFARHFLSLKNISFC